MSDDPIKDAAEAGSGVIQRRNNDWFDSVFWTRREPINSVVLVQTRWGKRDLAGYILSKEDDEPEWWHVVHFEAIKEDDTPDYPKTCIVEIDNREIGEALSPRYPLEKLQKICKRIGQFFWNAMYQQRPQLRAGRVYHAFDDKNIGPASYDLDLSKCEGFYHSHDFGAVNHVWGLWAKIGKQYYLVHEQQLPEGTTASRASIIKAKFGDKKVVSGYGGAAGENQYRLDFAKEGVIIRLPLTPKKTVSDQLVETQVRKANDMLAKETMMICSNMLMTIDQLENCIRDEKEGIMDKATWHYLDMCRYFAAGIGRGVFVG